MTGSPKFHGHQLVPTVINCHSGRSLPASRTRPGRDPEPGPPALCGTRPGQWPGWPRWAGPDDHADLRI